MMNSLSQVIGSIYGAQSIEQLRIFLNSLEEILCNEWDPAKGERQSVFDFVNFDKVPTFGDAPYEIPGLGLITPVYFDQDKKDYGSFKIYSYSPIYYLVCLKEKHEPWTLVKR